MAKSTEPSPAAKKLLSKFHAKMKVAHDKAGLAAIYINDGAIGQGGRLLSEAGLLFTEASELRLLALHS